MCVCVRVCVSCVCEKANEVMQQVSKRVCGVGKIGYNGQESCSTEVEQYIKGKTL